MKTAIIIFAYNRPKYLKRMLTSFSKCTPIPADIFAFVDYSAKQEGVVNILKEFSNMDIFPRTTHLGLRENIIDGVTRILNFYDAAIVIEDDLVLKKDALTFIYDKLFYRESGVGSVSAYKGNPLRFQSWCWGTWKDVWQTAEWNFTLLSNQEKIDFGKIGADLPEMYEKASFGDIDSWAISFAYHHFANNLLCLTPAKSLCEHKGRFGTHFHWYSIFCVRKYIKRIMNFIKGNNEG